MTALWVLGSPSGASALTAHEIFEKIVPRVQQPAKRHGHGKARTPKPSVNVPAKAAPTAKPIDKTADVPLPVPAPDRAAAKGSLPPLPPQNPLADASDQPVVPTPPAPPPRRVAEPVQRADTHALAFAPPVLPSPLSPNVAVAGSAILGAVLTPSDREAPVEPVPNVAPAHPAEDTPAAEMPLPREKPPIVLAAVVGPLLKPSLPDSPAACSAALAGLKISAKAEPAVSKGECGAPDPFGVSALEDGAVTLQPTATINCEMATMLSRWVTDEVQPAALAAYQTRVTALRVADSYSCRGRNQIVGAQLSEHAFMNAIDIAAFEIDGRWVTVEKGPDHTDHDTDFIQTIRHEACDIFLTVLGPGSDGYHENHLHLDMRHRGKNGGSRYCH